MKNTTKDRWSQLSMQQRADLIKLYVDGGIINIKDIKNHYNRFDEGGNVNVSDQANAIREQAYQTSIDTKNVRVPKVDLTKEEITELENELQTNLKEIQNYNRIKSKPFGTILTSEEQFNMKKYQQNNWYNNTLQRNEQIKKMLKDGCKDGSSCTYHSTGHYGPKYQMASSQEFADTNGRNAFVEVPKEQSKPGDIVLSYQKKENGEWEPHHTLMFSKWDEKGNPRYNASNGNKTNEGLRWNQLYNVTDSTRTYRFVGTPEDREMWNKTNKYATGGPTKEKGIKTWLNKRVLDRVPGDSEMLGTIGPVDAILKSIFNPKGYVDKRIKRAEDSYTKYKDWIEEYKIPKGFSSEDDWLNTLSNKEIEDIYLASDIEKIKQHEDAKRIYLGYEPKYGTMEESPYKPTIAKNSNTKYYQVNSLLQDREFEDFILPVWTEWKNPEYGTPIRQNVFGDEYKSSRVTNKGNVAGVSNAPYLNGLTISEGFDNKGQYISLYDTWDYNTKVQDKTGDNVGKYINGEPFEIYQRYYLDEWLDIPKEAQGNPWIVPAVLSVKQNNSYEEQESFKLGGRFLTKRRK